jgi:hypothetical protein
MKTLSAILFFTISSNSFAGLFCENFECDLSVPTYSDKVASTKIETRDISIKSLHTLKEIQRNLSNIIKTAPEKALEKALDNHDEASKVFNRPGERIKSCTAEIAGSLEVGNMEGTNMAYLVPLKLTCTIEILDKKNNTEMAEALCNRAMQCASTVDNAGKLASYLKLKEGLCGKNSDMIMPTGSIDSSGRPSTKENVNTGGSYGRPAETMSK